MNFKNVDWKTVGLILAGAVVKVFSDLHNSEKREAKIEDTCTRWLEKKFAELEMKYPDEEVKKE